MAADKHVLTYELARCDLVFLAEVLQVALVLLYFPYVIIELGFGHARAPEASLALWRSHVEVALCYCDALKERILFLELHDVLLLVIGIGDHVLGEVGHRVDIQAVRNLSDVSEEVQHVLVQVQPKRRLVQLCLVQNILVSEVELRLLGALHHVVGQLLYLLGCRVYPLVVQEFPEGVEYGEGVVFGQYQLAVTDVCFCLLAGEHEIFIIIIEDGFLGVAPLFLAHLKLAAHLV